MYFSITATPANIENNVPRLGETAPPFEADSTFGRISLLDYIGKWIVLFSHPEDFTPICTSEIIAFTHIEPRLKQMNCELIGLSTDSNRSHMAWIQTIEEFTGEKISFPIIADTDKKVALTYGMLMPNESKTETVRCIFVIDDRQIIRAMSFYPGTTGRNTDEILRLVQALQITANQNVATPANWQPGGLAINYCCPFNKYH